eukprot:27708-Chlamydomonas_euryale.AAC.1
MTVSSNAAPSKRGTEPPWPGAFSRTVLGAGFAADVSNGRALSVICGRRLAAGYVLGKGNPADSCLGENARHSIGEGFERSVPPQRSQGLACLTCVTCALAMTIVPTANSMNSCAVAIAEACRWDCCADTAEMRAHAFACAWPVLAASKTRSGDVRRQTSYGCNAKTKRASESLSRDGRTA